MKVKKMNKYDLIIYGCLIGAIICLCFGAKEYFSSSNNTGSMKSEISSAIKEVKGEETTPSNEEETIEVEPDSLKDYDKSSIVNKYFNDILDEIIKDDVISYDTLRTWNTYDTLEFKYIREVADNYYEYEVDIKINNKDAILPKERNESLSNDEYNVITLHIYILENAQNNSFKIRKVDI